MATTQQVQQLYIGLLGRAADKAGLDFWIQEIAAGNRTLDNVQAAFAASPEFTATYGGLTNRSDLVTAIYTNLFERAPDAAGHAYWVGTSLTADQLIAAFLQYASPADQTVINNKVTVAETYTNVAGGADFNKAAAADVVADVNGSLASVAAALNKLATGQLDGVLPAGAQLQAQAAAVAALDAYEKQVAADATTSKLFTAAQLADKEISLTEANAALGLANTARNAITSTPGSVESTTVLSAKASDAANAVTAAKNLLTVPEATLADKWIAATAAAEAAKPANATEKGGVIGALDADATFTGNSTLTGAYTDAATLYATYVAATPAERTAIDTAFTTAGVATFASFKATVSIDAADSDASKAAAAALDALDNTANGDAYADAVTAKLAADTLVTQAQAADKVVADVKAVADKLGALTQAVTDAGAALGAALTAANAEIKDLGAATVAGLTANAAKSDVFMFQTAVDTDDFSITGFGTGTAGSDFLVLGQGYTFNSGALSTGNSNALEFFLIKDGANTQVVVETKAFGNASATVDAATGVVTASPDAAVITLTGVTVDQLTVNNGVIAWA